MEGNPPGLHPPLPIRSNLSLRENPKKHVVTRDQRPQKVSGEDVGIQRSPPHGQAAEKPRPGVHNSPTASARPLLPPGQRRLGEQGASKANKSLESERWSPLADGNTVGREGRHFTVANVGNNGQIFLRCVVIG